MCDVLVHLTKAGSVVEVFAGGVCVRIKIMNQPGRREDPVLKAFVVVAILRIGSEHTVEDRPGETGPFGCFGSFSIKSVGGYTKPGYRNESVILAVGKGAARLWFEVIRNQASLLDEF